MSLGDRRPTQLIRRYGNLYTEGRLDALDALDDVTEMTEFSDLKGKLLLTILVVSFTWPTWIMIGCLGDGNGIRPVDNLPKQSQLENLIQINITKLETLTGVLYVLVSSYFIPP